jgi:hypothetical protein
MYGSVLFAVQAGVDKTKNNSGASIFFLQIRAKKTMNQTKLSYIF